MGEDNKSEREMRDEALERLLRQALKRQRPDSAGECPDPSILAAYFEHALDASETSHWEAHFSTCPRCLEALGALARSTTAEPGKAQVTSTSAASKRAERTHATRRYLGWRWLVPAAGMAAAVAVASWIALRPASPWKAEVPTPVAQQTAPAPKETRATPPATRAESAERPAPAPSKPGETSETAARALADRAQLAAKQKAKLATPGAGAPGLPPEAMMAAKARPTETAPAAPKRAMQVEAGGGEELAKSEANTAAPQAEKVEVTKSAAAGENVVMPPAAPEAAPTQFRMAERKALAGGQVGGAVGGLVAARPRPALVASPSRKVLWRAGPGGKIEKSLDLGQTWETQTSPVAADLTAAWAPSDTVCWVVGRAGTILVTTDGEHWERISSPWPAGATEPPDWTRVRAQDAQHATIFSATGQTYTTTDGGKSWHAE